MTKTLCKMLICMLIGICVVIHIFVACFCFNCKVWLSLAFLCKFVLVRGPDSCEPEPNLVNPFTEVRSKVLKII
jgi:hypothetical protein